MGNPTDRADGGEPVQDAELPHTPPTPLTAATTEPSTSPDPAALAAAKAAAKAARSSAKVLNQERLAKEQQSGGITEPLQRLLLIRPMTNYFYWLARKEFPEESAASQVSSQKIEAPRLYRWCVWLDFVLQAVGAVALLVLTIALAVKATR